MLGVISPIITMFLMVALSFAIMRMIENHQPRKDVEPVPKAPRKAPKPIGVGASAMHEPVGQGERLGPRQEWIN